MPKSQKEAWIFHANLESQEDRIVWITYSQALQFMGAYPNQTLTQYARPSASKIPRGTRCAAKAKQPTLRWGWAAWGQGRDSIGGTSGARVWGAGRLQSPSGSNGQQQGKRSIREPAFNKQLCETSYRADINHWLWTAGQSAEAPKGKDELRIHSAWCCSHEAAAEWLSPILRPVALWEHLVCLSAGFTDGE